MGDNPARLKLRQSAHDQRHHRLRHITPDREENLNQQACHFDPKRIVHRHPQLAGRQAEHKVVPLRQMRILVPRVPAVQLHKEEGQGQGLREKADIQFQRFFNQSRLQVADHARRQFVCGVQH